VSAIKAWTWQAIDRVQVRVMKVTDGLSVPLVRTEVFQRNKQLEAVGRTQLLAELEGYVTTLTNHPNAPNRSGLNYDPAGSTVRDDANTDLSLYEAFSHWSTAPHPIGETLNLSRSFWVDIATIDLENGESYWIFAAPEFTDAAAMLHAIDTSSQPAPLDPSSPVVFEWNYRPTGRFDVRAYIRPVTRVFDATFPPPEPPTTLTDNNLMRRSNGWLAIGTQPWLAYDSSSEMEMHIATACDLAQRLVDVFRQSIPSNPMKTLGELIEEADQLDEFRDAVVAVLHDSAGLGNRPAPNGATLLDYYLQRFLPPRLEFSGSSSADDEAICKGQARSFHACIQDWDARLTLSGWCNQLRAALGSTRPSILGLE